MARNLYIAATGKDVGKSTISLAMINKLQGMNKKVGFMKPVGQRWLPSDWGDVEEDVILMKQVFDLPENPADMNPVVVRRGFTQEYLSKLIKPDLGAQILAGYKRVAADKDYVIIEGTGHGGVGSVIDKSNADVAKLLQAKVVLLTKGGIGSAIDRLELNRVFFENRGVQVIGVIINKVIPSKYDKVKRNIEHYCKSKKLKLFGVIPFSPILSNPTLGQVIEELCPEVISDTDERKQVLDSFVVGASNLDEFVEIIAEKKGNILLIFPSARKDLIFALPNLKKIMDMSNKRIFAILFSGMQKPSDLIMKLALDDKINLLWKKGDTYSVISSLSKISIKTRASNTFKIDEIKNIVSSQIEYKNIFSRLSHSKFEESNLSKFKSGFLRFFGKRG